MFENVAGTLKSLAKVILFIGIIMTMVIGINFVITTGDNFFIGIIIMVFGALGTWISSYVIYALGELLESTCEIRKKICGYDNGNSKYQPFGKCEICNKNKVELHRCKVDDIVGWADMCEDCMNKRGK